MLVRAMGVSFSARDARFAPAPVFAFLALSRFLYGVERLVLVI